MNGDLPEIYWYLFWVGVLVFMVAFSFAMMWLIHQRNMKTIELLRKYAEKGVEPPPAMAELLASSGSSDQKWKSTRRGALLQSFIGMAFTACAAGGIAWWRIDAGGPQAVIYFFGAAAVFFAVSALGLLVAALFTRD